MGMKARPKPLLTCFLKAHSSWTGFMFFADGTWHPVEVFVGGQVSHARSLCGRTNFMMTYLIDERTACPECMDALVKVYGGELEHEKSR